MADNADATPSLLVASALAGPISSVGDIWGALLGDRLSTWRFNTAMRTAQRAREEAARLGLRLRNDRIPDRFTVAWFEEASKCDEVDLSEMFARLLARVASSDSAEVEPDRRLPEIISKLSPADANLFNLLYSGSPFPGGQRSTGGSGPFKADFMREDKPISLLMLHRVISECFGAKGMEAIEALEAVGLVAQITDLEVRRPSHTPRQLGLSPGSEATNMLRSTTKLRTLIGPTLVGRRLYRATKQAATDQES